MKKRDQREAGPAAPAPTTSSNVTSERAEKTPVAQVSLRKKNRMEVPQEELCYGTWFFINIPAVQIYLIEEYGPSTLCQAKNKSL